MKKIILYLIVIQLFINFNNLKAQQPQHFTFTQNTADMGTVVLPLGTTSINGLPLDNGDEIGMFNPSGLCVGAVIFQSNINLGVTVWGDDEMTGNIDGLIEGDTIKYRFWKNQTNTEYTDLGVIYHQGNGVYESNCMFVIHALYYGTKPNLNIPILINPPDLSVDMPISVLNNWHPVNIATNYRLQVSEQPNFSSINFEYHSLTDTFNFVTNLLYDKFYFWRVKAYNSTDSSFWSFTWKFKTKKNVIDKPNLIYPENLSSNIPLSTNFEWNKVAKANRYRLQLSLTVNFSDIVLQDDNITDTTLLVNNLEHFTQYFWRVKAFDNTDSSYYSDVWRFTTLDYSIYPPVLNSPQNYAINISKDTILSWYPVANAMKYRLQISENSSFTSLLYDLSSIEDTFFIVTSLAYSKQYYWRLKASNDTDSSIWSETWSFTTIDLNLNTPVLLSPENNSVGIPKDTILKWHLVTEAMFYKLQLSTFSDFSDILLELDDLFDTTFILNNLSYETKYYWRIQAWHNSIFSNWSSTWNFTTIAEPLESPYLIYPPNNEILSADSITFKWSKNSKNPEYIFQLAVDSTFFDIRHTKILDDTTTTINDLDKEINYYWRVRVQKNNQISNWSDVWNFVIDKNFSVIDTPILVHPSNFSAQTPIKPLFIWQKVKYATNYLLQVSEFKEFGNNKIEINLVDTSYIPTLNIDTNTHYYWRVAAFKDEIVSHWSEVWSFTTGVVTLQPPVLVSPPNNSEKIPVNANFVWKTVENAKSYRFQLSTTREFDVILFEAPFFTDTSLFKEKLAYDYKYFWRVRAENNAVFSAWSEVWIFSTIDEEDTLKITKLITPADKSIDILTNTLFSWHTIDDIDSYQLQISKSSDFLNILFNISHITDSSYFLKNLEINTTYFWRVRCADETQSYTWSDIWSFKTISENIIYPPEEWNFTDNTGNFSTIIALDVFSNNYIINNRNLMIGDAIGVFYTSGEEYKCAGYALCTNVNTPIIVWGDDEMTGLKDGFDEKETYTIKVWDSRAGKEYFANVRYSLGNDYYMDGGFSIIDGLNTYFLDTLNINLYLGWNLISSNVIPNEADMDIVFDEVSNDVIYIRNNNNQRCFPQYAINEIGNWNINDAYWVFSVDENNLNITGKRIETTNYSINLSSGWTLLPYWLNFNQDCEITFKDIKDNLLIAKDLYGNLYIPSYNFNTLKTITPGMGLQCYFKDNTTLIFDDTTKSNEEKISPVFNENLMGNCTSFSAVIIANIVGYDGYSVAAYNSQDQMVGIGTAKNDYAIFTVWGEDYLTHNVHGALINELLSIKVFQEGDTIIYNYDINNVKNLIDNEEYTELKYFQNGVLLLNGIVNSIDENFLNNDDFAICPNPAEDYINIDFFVENEANATITIYSINGDFIDKLNISNLVYGINQKLLDVSELNSGVYSIKLQLGNKVVIKRFVVI